MVVRGPDWARTWTCTGLKLAPLALLPLVRGGGVDEGDEGGGASYVELDESVRGGCRSGWGDAASRSARDDERRVEGEWWG